MSVLKAKPSTAIQIVMETMNQETVFGQLPKNKQKTVGVVDFLDNFIRVSEQQPCLKCQKTDWCVIHKTGRYGICQRHTGHRLGDAGYKYTITERVALPPPKRNKNKLTSEEVEELVKSGKVRITPTQIESLAKWLSVAEQALIRLSIGWDGYGGYMFPMQDGFGNNIGVRVRRADGKKLSVKGGREGIFCPINIYGCKENNPLFLTEGPTDCAALLSLGLFAIGKPNNIGGDKQIKNLLCHVHPKELVVVADNDVPGILGAVKTAGFFGNCKIVVPRIGKDARECCKHQTDSEDIIGCINGQHSLFWELLSHASQSTVGESNLS